jgi:hypothetical protein
LAGLDPRGHPKLFQDMLSGGNSLIDLFLEHLPVGIGESF